MTPPVEANPYGRRARAGRHYQLVPENHAQGLHGWPKHHRDAVGDPDPAFYENCVGGVQRNYSGYCNAEVDKIVDP